MGKKKGGNKGQGGEDGKQDKRTFEEIHKVASQEGDPQAKCAIGVLERGRDYCICACVVWVCVCACVCVCVCVCASICACVSEVRVSESVSE